MMPFWTGDVTMRPLMRPAMLVPVLLAVCAGCQQPVSMKRPDPTPAADKGEAAGGSERALTGTQSCGNRGCHASMDQSNADKKPLECSYTIWSVGDPHKDAWNVLSNDRGRRMSQLLHPGADDKGGAPAVARDRRCLACHATPQSAFDQAPFDEHGVAKLVDEEWKFGVGCEACHGRATKWREAHYQEKWTTGERDERQKQELAKRKAELGYNDLSDLRQRAMVCAGCHVGAPEDKEQRLPLRDMNHDHVAARHPRLMFEFTSFLSNEPPHWLEKNTGADRFARAWLMGQLASAEASLRLTADRARAAAEREKSTDAAKIRKLDLERPWPELTEYDCYACHQTLSLDSWRVGLDSVKGGGPGRFRPSRWYTGLLADLGAVQKADLDELESLLRKPRPPAEAVAKKATSLANALSKYEPTKIDADQLRKALIARGQIPSDPSKWQLTWDECEQIALGLLALERSRDSKEGQDQAKKLLELLRFPPGNEAQTTTPPFREIVRQKGKKDSPFDDEWRKLFPKQ
jgi:hypothetical protein